MHASDFKNLQSEFSNRTDISLLKRKGVFPYSYLDSFDRLKDTQLPDISHFYNQMRNEECSQSEYQHAQNVWNEFNCETMKDYLRLYLKTDVLILADVFQNFRGVCLKIYNLDPAQYFTAPGLSWDAMLKTTGVNLELLTDLEMYKFIQGGIRGGIVQCTRRHAVANHKYLDDYDSSKPSEYLMYLDVNNLYGYAMSHSLPYGGFKWLDDFNHLDISNIPSDSPTGYILEVDLDYPAIHHDKHNDFPFCAENGMLGSMKVNKLLGTLYSKKNYVIHYRTLQQCLKHGLVLTKIHRVLTFHQSEWLKQYIDLNNTHRTNAKNDFEKNFFKLLNNAVYGKTMENVDKRVDVKIVTKWESEHNSLGARAWTSKPNFHSVTVFNEDMAAVQLNRMNICYNKAIYVGFAVLELSKYRMYEFHYDFMLPKFGDKLKLNYMDTDSFIYSIKTADFYADIKNDIDKWFDTSAYPIDNIFKFHQANKKVLGMMKDECNGKFMKEFIGLRAKMYCYTLADHSEVRKAKGVPSGAMKNIKNSDYKNCLFNKERHTTNGIVYTFRSRAHTIYTEAVNKIVLNSDIESISYDPTGSSISNSPIWKRLLLSSTFGIE